MKKKATALLSSIISLSTNWAYLGYLLFKFIWVVLNLKSQGSKYSKHGVSIACVQEKFGYVLVLDTFVRYVKKRCIRLFNMYFGAFTNEMTSKNKRWRTAIKGRDNTQTGLLPVYPVDNNRLLIEIMLRSNLIWIHNLHEWFDNVMIIYFLLLSVSSGSDSKNIADRRFW